MQNEHSPYEKILILAATRSAKIIVIAHGYFQKASSLVTVSNKSGRINCLSHTVEMLLGETGYNEKDLHMVILMSENLQIARF